VVKGVVVICGPTQVVVEYSVSTGGLLIASWSCTLVVEVVVGAAAVSTLRSLVAGHA